MFVQSATGTSVTACPVTEGVTVIESAAYHPVSQDLAAFQQIWGPSSP